MAALVPTIPTRYIFDQCGSMAAAADQSALDLYSQGKAMGGEIMVILMWRTRYFHDRDIIAVEAFTI